MVTISEIFEAAAQEYGATKEFVLDRSRKLVHVYPRHAAITVAWEAGHSKSGIAREIRCNHATIINAIFANEAICFVDPVQKKHYTNIKNRLGLS